MPAIKISHRKVQFPLSPFPYCQLFQVHARKSKRHLHRHPGTGSSRSIRRDAPEYGRPLEAAGVVLAEGGEARDWIQKAIDDEPPAGDAYVDFLYDLPHAADTEQILDEDELEKGYRVDAGMSHGSGRV